MVDILLRMEDKTTSRIVIIEKVIKSCMLTHLVTICTMEDILLNNDRIGVAAAKKFGSLANPRNGNFWHLMRWL